MRKFLKLLNTVRKANGVIIKQGDDGFACQIPRQGFDLCIIVSWGEGWDHVSVHARTVKGIFVPVWEDMCYVKNLFFKASETVVQYHPPSDVYVNNHKGTLHLWRSQNEEMKLPPIWMV